MADAPNIEDISLGDRYRDTITGFDGVVIGRADYLTGCAQALLTRLANTGDVASRWFDYPTLEKVGDERVQRGAAGIGGPPPIASTSRPTPR